MSGDDKPLIDYPELGKALGEMIFNHRHCMVCHKPILASEFDENNGRCRQDKDKDASSRLP